MYELVQAGANTYYVNCPAKIGIYRFRESEVWLIDSGSDKDAAKRVKRILDANGWILKGIICTHYHADHVGGNHRLQQQTSCKIFAADMEASLIRYPVLEPSLLYGGYPGKDLRHKFLMAEKSQPVSLEDVDFPKELEVIPLPGHSFQMIGIRTPDNVVFLADCVSSATTLEKYKISVIYDVETYLKTLDAVDQLEAELFVPAHAEAADDIRPLTEINRQAVKEITEKILELLETPRSFENLLKNLFDFYQLKMTFEQHVLVGSTVRSYLSWMKDRGEVQVDFVDNYMLWSRI